MHINSATARVRSSAAAFLIATALAFPVAAAPADSRASTTATNTPAIRIDNFGRVDSSLYRGAQPEGRDFADLKALGVKTIVNLTSDDADPNEKAMTEAAGMSYVQIAMTTHTTPTAAQLAQFLGIVNDPASQPVFVHCVGGRHRTGVMTAAYRMTHDGWTGEQAFREMKQYKFGSDFLHPEFREFVYGYHPDVHAASAAATTASVQR
jgi:tyrosine-protein phosphatase SIW14